jgi:hypothetical protein
VTDALWVVVPAGVRASGEWIDDTLAERAREKGLLARTPLAVPAAPAGIRRAAVGPGGQEEGAHAAGERG